MAATKVAVCQFQSCQPPAAEEAALGLITNHKTRTNIHDIV
ncbi:hypothetical protein COLO4_28610 [Corchorus olitorius]|uniref:Uncharacterized protein n=1 Tax=Corchorus olitorius TaxID=93759 RepID=A0A1R3HJH3_9ROSI|nr:hypothetical protein COLO4_28610 [Corchorus olitorius]